MRFLVLTRALLDVFCIEEIGRPMKKMKRVKMIRVKKNALLMALSLGCESLGFPPGANPVTNAQELVAHHLESIASPAALAGLRTRVVQGSLQFTILAGGTGPVVGKAVLVSENEKLVFIMKLPNHDYRGEQFVFDGDKDKVAFANAQQSRSALGDFVFTQDAVIREGLLGGVLSTAWPLLNLNRCRAKLSLEGLKKVDGRELYDLRYHTRQDTALEIHLYFDPQTYRHVETVYSFSNSEGLADAAPASPERGKFNAGAYDDSKLATGKPSASAPGANSETHTGNQLPNRYRLQEKFSDFKTVDGVTLPTQDDLQFSQFQNGKTTLSDWDLKGLAIANNIGVDAKNFEVK
jgi:hypothetical protein